jgi:hypothetical protein
MMGSIMCRMIATFCLGFPILCGSKKNSLVLSRMTELSEKESIISKLRKSLDCLCCHKYNYLPSFQHKHFYVLTLASAIHMFPNPHKTYS